MADMRHLRLRVLGFVLSIAAVLGSASPGGLLAQESATLVADQLEIAAESQLIAQGSVEVFYQGRRLTAQRIVYDQAADSLTIEGPIRLTDETGNTVILAAQAELSADMTEGILNSARVVLDQQLQIAAGEMRRAGGRYLQLDNAIASRCQVCSSNSTPLWEIRARRVLHDQLERQIYFDHAQLRVAGVPVFYIPRLRMPDPTLNRTSGFLKPTLSNTTGLGTGITLPYFVVLGPSRDLTFSPTITSNGSRTLEMRYRQSFERGDISITGNISRDRIQPGQTRGLLGADGTFQLDRGFVLTFHIGILSDTAYLADYGISNTDRLQNQVAVERVRRNDYSLARIVSSDSLRDGEASSATPYLVVDSTYIRRFQLGQLGGEGNLRFSTHQHTRQSSNATDSAADADDIAEGADQGRISIGADWQRNWVMSQGILGAVLGEMRLDSFSISDDATYQGNTVRLSGAVAAEFRWPFQRVETGGATQILEPIAQLVWSPSDTKNLPNEDSRLVEFDEGNLFSLNRFPGSDVVETGMRLNLGVSWTRLSPDGWTLGVTAGRVFRDEPIAEFSNASGLGTTASDWMLAVTAESPNGLLMAGRLIAEDSLSVTRGELHLDYATNRMVINSGYIWSVADAYEARPDRISELVLGGRYNVTPNWTATASGLYDFEADSYRLADFGLTYLNECVRFDLSLSRRFTSSTTVKPSTVVDLSVALLGFGGGGSAGPARVCRQ
jgi:LPS-assembly protein